MFENKYRLSVLKEMHKMNNIHIIRTKIESRFRSNNKVRFYNIFIYESY